MSRKVELLLQASREVKEEKTMGEKEREDREAGIGSGNKGEVSFFFFGNSLAPSLPSK